ncbi:MAG: bifunctional hydroxymethylpyrimidine kinase/phosphomethylpyrimidine kinase [Rhodocyclaceae bacterium]|nr:bifunctional hydroxymethylpyrimidine kinase/phosphomethylpyrimidine kinase [Rhodocyclaceae bacterium]
MIPTPPAVLCFSSSDPTGGDGLQSDILVLASMGCHPLTIPCALLASDTRGVEEVVMLEPETVAVQARVILEDIAVRAFRMGMVGSVENLAAVAEIIADYPELPLVVEVALPPGGTVGEDDCDDYLGALAELVLPQATVTVVSDHDLPRLWQGDGEEDDDDRGREECIAHLLALGGDYVLVTGAGGGGAQQVVNQLHGAQGLVRADAWEKLAGDHVGARSTLAAAIAASLANGMDVPTAVREAQEYAWQALAAGYRPGMGRMLPDRLFWARDEGDADD